MTKYRVAVTWKSGYVDNVYFNNEILATYFLNDCLQRYNIESAQLFKEIDEKIDWSYKGGF